MLTGELPFNAPTVAGILMKQITEPAPLVHLERPEVPEDLSLAVARCLEKDPENRWPTADALRRALESRNVAGYRPTSAGMPASRRTGTRPRPSPSARTGRPPAPVAPRASGTPRPSGRPNRPAALAGGQWVRNERGEWVRTKPEPMPAAPDTGEPKLVQTVRAQFARWAAVTGGCFMLNVATGLDGPWFLFVAGGMGIPLLKSYAQLWQSGYSWRDVLNRPPAPGSVEAASGRGPKGRRMITPPTENEYGAYVDRVEQAHTDRAAILGIIERLPAADRELLPDVVETTESLYERARELARTLNDLDQGFRGESADRIKRRIDEVSAQPPSEERDRQIRLLEQQHRTATELMSRRQAIADRLESSVLAMQNVRFDLIRLRSAGVSNVIGDLTQATQQARALSRDVDHVIAAASEIREAMG
jgi:serine/threonine-protein kinase